MGRPVSPRTIKIRTALAEHTAIPVIARRYGVTESYVYAIRRNMKKVAPGEAPKRRVRRVTAVPLPAPVVTAAPVPPVLPPPPPSLWQRVLAVFRR